MKVVMQASSVGTSARAHVVIKKVLQGTVLLMGKVRTT